MSSVLMVGGLKLPAHSVNVPSFQGNSTRGVPGNSTPPPRGRPFSSHGPPAQPVTDLFVSWWRRRGRSDDSPEWRQGQVQEHPTDR